MAKLFNTLLFGGVGTNSKLGDIGLTILRVGAGVQLAVLHGWVKVYDDGNWGPPSGLLSSTENLGFPAPLLFAWCAMLAEFLGGILLALGLFTRPAAFLIMSTMTVAAFGAPARAPGAPPDQARRARGGARCFLLAGGGTFAIDRYFRR